MVTWYANKLPNEEKFKYSASTRATQIKALVLLSGEEFKELCRFFISDSSSHEQASYEKSQLYTKPTKKLTGNKRETAITPETLQTIVNRANNSIIKYGAYCKFRRGRLREIILPDHQSLGIDFRYYSQEMSK